MNKTYKNFVEEYNNLNEVSQSILDRKEEIFKSLKKRKKEFQDRYGDEAESIMHGTAMNMAKKELGESYSEDFELMELIAEELENTARTGIGFELELEDDEITFIDSKVASKILENSSSKEVLVCGKNKKTFTEFLNGL